MSHLEWFDPMSTGFSSSTQVGIGEAINRVCSFMDEKKVSRLEMVHNTDGKIVSLIKEYRDVRKV